MPKEMRVQWAETLVELAKTDDRVIVLDADLAGSTRADIFADAHPEKFFEIGIAEQHLVGMAAGLATMGYRPWLSSFGLFFTQRALDQIRMLVSQTLLPVKISGCYAGLLNGSSGKTHQDIEDIAIMRAMPNMTVIAPADPAEAGAAIAWAADHDGPVYVRLAREAEVDVFGADYAFELGRPRVIRQGNDVTLISTGIQSARVLEATELLAARGIDARLIHLPTIKPLDTPAFLELITGVDLLITIEEHSILGGLGGMISEIVADAAPGTRVVRLGLADAWSESGPSDFLLDKYGLSPERVAQQVCTVLATSCQPA